MASARLSAPPDPSIPTVRTNAATQHSSERRSTKFLPVFIGVIADLGKHAFIITVAAKLVTVLVLNKPRVVVRRYSCLGDAAEHCQRASRLGQPLPPLTTLRIRQLPYDCAWQMAPIAPRPLLFAVSCP